MLRKYRDEGGGESIRSAKSDQMNATNRRNVHLYVSIGAIANRSGTALAAGNVSLTTMAPSTRVLTQT